MLSGRSWLEVLSPGVEFRARQLLHSGIIHLLSITLSIQYIPLSITEKTIKLYCNPPCPSLLHSPINNIRQSPQAFEANLLFIGTFSSLSLLNWCKNTLLLEELGELAILVHRYNDVTAANKLILYFGLAIPPPFRILQSVFRHPIPSLSSFTFIATPPTPNRTTS
jgi:hypothetical protein